MNTLRAVVETDAAGVITAARVEQTAAPSHPTLRPHRIAIGSYTGTGTSALVRTHRVELDIDGPSTDVPELVGLPQPDLLLVNDDDLTYAKVRLDERSFATAVARLAELADPVARAVVLGSAWDAVRDAELPASEFVRLVLAGVGHETQSAARGLALTRLELALGRYLADDHRERIASETGDAVWALAELAETGSDAQLQFVKAFTRIAATQAHADVLGSLLDGSIKLPGLDVDLDLRWELVIARAALGAASDEEIDGALALDDTAKGRQLAETARAARPDQAVKDAAWRRVATDTSLSNDLARAIAEGWRRTVAPELLASTVTEYFDLAAVDVGEPELHDGLARGVAPLPGPARRRGARRDGPSLARRQPVARAAAPARLRAARRARARARRPGARCQRAHGCGSVDFHTMFRAEEPTVPPIEETPLSGDFWSGLAQYWADNWDVIVGKLISIAVIIAIAFLIRWILHFVIDRVVNRIVSGVKKKQDVTDTQALQASPLAAVRVVQRTRTLGSVLRNIVNVTLFIIVTLMIVNVIDTSILGSFALLGAAIGAGLGFGAQNIVKDVLNGLFMVVEDQLGVGDVVDLGPATGIVEEVQIRITKVRDVNGTLWFVRNGEILRVGNMSQGWARVILDLAVPYDADVDAVEAEMLRTAVEMSQSGKWRSRVLEKPEIWGLESISDEAMVIRIVMKVRTSSKDDVARELRTRLKRSLDAMDVKLPSLSSVVLTRLRGRHPREGREAAEDGAEHGRDGCRGLDGDEDQVAERTQAPDAADHGRHRMSDETTPQTPDATAFAAAAPAPRAPGTSGPVQAAGVPLRGSEHGAALGPSFYETVGGRETFERLVARVLPRRRRRPGAPADVSRGGPRAGRRAAHDVPRAVLGRPRHLQRAARPPPAAHAAPALQGEPRGARPLARAHARRRRLARPAAAAEETLWDYLQRAAFAMVNTFED